MMNKMLVWLTMANFITNDMEGHLDGYFKLLWGNWWQSQNSELFVNLVALRSTSFDFSWHPKPEVKFLYVFTSSF